jgi:hypothetical protein
VRWRGQVRAWSVLPAAALVIVVGSLFWVTMWIVLRPTLFPATRTLTQATSAVESTEGVYDDADEYVAYDVDDPELEGVRVAQGVADDVDAMAVACCDNPGEQQMTYAVAPSTTTAVALGDSPGEQVASYARQGPDRSADLTARADEITARADDITSRAEALTARTEELTVKIEGLTAKIEEMESKLATTGAVLAALPAIAPSPVPVPNTTVAMANRTGQTPVNGRVPWVVSPLPEPGTRVVAGPVLLETRARGEAPIAQIRLQLDGMPVQVVMEKRDDTTWRGRASVRVAAGSHTVAVAVVDGQGRIGTYRWQFDASPS